MSIKLEQGRSRQLLLTASIAIGLMLAGCGGGKGGNNISPNSGNTPDIKMVIPDSLTGGSQGTGVGGKGADGIAAISKAGTGEPCHYIGDEDEDHFRNGYKITKLLVSAVATWSCIGDLLIDVSEFVDHDGSIHVTDNDRSSPDYKSKDPTHYSVTDDSDSQTTVRLYYGYYRETPPQVGEDPQFYISWNEGGDEVLQGRIVVDARNIDLDHRKDEDPVMLAMNFEYDSDKKEADMFLRFDDGNEWAEGFRIHLVRDMNATPLEKVYVARGRIEMKAQFHPVDTIKEIPTADFYTVSNLAGKGAAIADFADVSLPVKIYGITGSHLGYYLFSKEDTYFFQENGDPDWIQKLVSEAVYRGYRTTPATGGSWPLSPSLDLIAEHLQLGKDYFTGDKCVSEGDDCTQLIQAIFDHYEDFTNQEKNQGEDPHDWRSDAIATPDYLKSIYPNGLNWNGAFDFTFTPSL